MTRNQFQSPQILMVSGVGPANILKDHNIPVISDLPGVGQNMWDHFLFGASYRVATVTHSALNNASFSESAAVEYHKNGSGLFGNPGGDILAWEKLPYPRRRSLSKSTRTALAKFPSDWPEIEYLVLDAYSGDNENYIAGAPKTPYMYASPAAALVAPLSRGNISTSSADSADPPLINPNWLTHPADQELAIAAFRRIRELMDTDSMRRVLVGSEIVPGRNITTDRDILKSIKNNGIQSFHASGTCKHALSREPFAEMGSSCPCSTDRSDFLQVKWDVRTIPWLS